MLVVDCGTSLLTAQLMPCVLVRTDTNEYGFFCSSRRRHTRCALVTGVQTCALPILHDLLYACAHEPGGVVDDLVVEAGRKRGREALELRQNGIGGDRKSVV